ncbi:TonB-dependent receptor plug domain-containing protein [Sabulibacter ruber]|uniref:TonB-dependent receptor plug domain-containing protein n=1 Tax=Sabulibacter ruber TaxID=2811901 RepID=UPI001A9605F0|nr:TonB-dependent receptor plug domain-containing protein [Sabulibacter ruber]
MSPKSYLRLALFSLGLLLVCAFAPKQWQENEVLKKIIAQLQQFTKDYPQEKVYLHLDKPYYAAGDDLWFKAYLVNASSHEPSLVSKVLYVELVSPEDSIYRRIAVDVKNGIGHGDLALEDTIPEGLYRLRAYTSWMQNFDETYFFHQNVQIFNPRLADLVPKVDFTFKRYAAGDSVWADVSLKNLKEEPLGQRSLTFHTRNRMGKMISPRRNGQTNSQGQARFAFFLPITEAQQDIRLWMTVKEGENEIQRRFKIPQVSEKVDLQFFPEGGELVNNMWSVVGFKAIDANGMGKDVQGTVLEETGKKVTDFKSQKFGMGRFGFLPQPGKNYLAILRNEDGTETRYPLPTAREKGVVMRVDNSKPNAVQMRAYLVGYRGYEGRPTSISMVVQSRGNIYFTGHATTDKDLIQISVPREKLPSGVVQFTLFSHPGEPLAERLVFVNRQDQLQLTLTPDKPSYKPREKVTMHLQAKNAAGSPVSGHFSVAVTDAQKVTPEPYANTILTNLLLTSDLRGHIEQPGYYFSSQEQGAAEALDNLMLTQGWRRFVWNDLLQNKPLPLPFPVERGMAVTGTVQKLSGKPEPKAIVTLISLRSPGMILIDTADAQGKFAFAVSQLDDSARIAVKARSAKGKDVLEVIMDKGVPITLVTPQPPYDVPPAMLSQSTWAYLRSNREQLRLDQLAGKSILLSTVEIRARKIREEEEMRRGQLYNQPDYSLKGSNLPQAQDIISALQGRVAGLMSNGGEISLRGGDPPLYLLDGMPIDVEYVRGISMTEVEAIDIIKPGPSSTIFGSQGGNGVISIILKQSGPGTFTSKARYRGVAAYNGVRMQKAREFYMPRYDQSSEVELPDLRTTLFWSPTIVTDTNGQATFSFYCADARTSYRAVVEGLTANGQLGRATADLQVR